MLLVLFNQLFGTICQDFRTNHHNYPNEIINPAKGLSMNLTLQNSLIQSDEKMINLISSWSSDVY